MNLSQLRTRANGLSGFDLSDAEATDLINEAIRDFARLSGFPRKVWEFETVADTTEYELPSDFIKPVTVRVAGYPLDGTDTNTIADLQAGILTTNSDGAWYLSDDQGHLGIWRTPAEAQTVSVQYVYQPLPLVLDDDVPGAFPDEFHPALIFYVGSVYYATVEDNPDLAAVNDDRYRAKAEELNRHRISLESADETFAIGIAGVTA